MAAYADVFSLISTFRRMINSSYISIAPSSQEILDPIIDEILNLAYVLERLDRNFGDVFRCSERMNALDGRATEALRTLQDCLDSYMYDRIILSQSDDDHEEEEEEERPSLIFDLVQVRPEVRIFTQLVKEMEEYFEELKSTPLPEDEDAAAASSESDHIDGNKPKMIVFSKIFEYIQHVVSRPWIFPGFESGRRFVAVLFGMAGVGKTTIAKEAYEQPSNLSRFDCRVWVTVGQRYTWKQVIRRILAQVDPENYKATMEVGDKELLAGLLSKSLKDRKYLIVLDDVWDDEIWDGLRYCLPDDCNHSVVLLTTRLGVLNRECDSDVEINLMDKEKSWDLLRVKVFGEERCPPLLEKAGKKIAETCEGLPLLIVEVAKLLSKAEKTPEYWNEVAEKKNSVFIDAHDQILEVLIPSYTHLDIDYKASYVYMGVFPEKYEIRLRKLLILLVADGIVINPSSSFADDFAQRIMLENLAIYDRGQRETITCRLHSVFWHLSYREAEKNKFFHVLKNRPNNLTEDMKGHHRLCIHNNILFSIKDVNDTMTSISTVRSLLCTGQYQQYPVPLCFDLRLLKVLNALTIRFYEFPMEVVKLVLLRYLALTYDGTIPLSISKLWNLEYLIVHRHLSIKSSGDMSYLPMQIWDLKELKYLKVMGSNLPDPRGAILSNLLSLSGVSAQSCTKCVFERLPNLEKLGVQIELSPDATEPLSCFDHIVHLNTLKSLKCVVQNPNLRYPQAPVTNFPPGLTKLSLSGCGYPWEEMKVIASLPNLEVLKLRCYAFRGPMWDMRNDRLFVFGLESLPSTNIKEYDNTFEKLEFLFIEDTDMVQWRITRASFPLLVNLTLKHCYKLKEIPLEFAFSETLEWIDVVDCNPSAVICAKQIQDVVKKHNRKSPGFTIHIP